MRLPAPVLAALLAAAPLAAAASSVTGTASGTVLLQEWDVFNLWVNSTSSVTETLTWTLTTAMEDLSITVYKPGAWDAQCKHTAHACSYFQKSSDIVKQSRGCPPLHSSETATFSNVGAKRYHVAVEGNVGRNVPYTLATSVGSLTYNGTASAVVAYVLPC